MQVTKESSAGARRQTPFSELHIYSYAPILCPQPLSRKQPCSPPPPFSPKYLRVSMVTGKCPHHPSHGGHPFLTSPVPACALTWPHSESCPIYGKNALSAPTCLLPQERKWVERSPSLTGCPAPERSPSLSAAPSSAPGIGARRTALAASALRRSSVAFLPPTHRWDSSAEDSPPPGPKATAKLGAADGDAGTQLPAGPTAAPQPPAAASLQPPNPRVPAGARAWLSLG